jgi:excisionase family DNA binding protein
MSLYRPLEQLACELELTQAQAKKLLKRGRIPFSKLSNKTIMVKTEDEGVNNNIMNQDDILTVRECAKLLSISAPTLYQWVRMRKIPYIRVGVRTIRFSRTEIEKWLKENTFQQF